MTKPAPPVLSAPVHESTYDPCSIENVESQEGMLVCAQNKADNTDRQMNELWANLKSKLSVNHVHWSKLTREQKKWIKQRDKKCGKGNDLKAIDCHHSETENRNQVLQNLLEQKVK